MGSGIQHRIVQLMKHLHRIESPKLGTMAFQQVKYGSGFRVPAPPEVEGQLAQTSYSFG